MSKFIKEISHGHQSQARPNYRNEWNLLKHPFYQAWSAGTLPMDALAYMPASMGSLLPHSRMGWETLRDQETANEEREHIQLWDEF